jgi:basic membrane protein A
MKKLFLLLVAFVLVFSMAACKDEEEGGMVLLLPGPISDQSWNAANYSGLVAANEQLDLNIEYVENVVDADMVSTMRSYAESGYTLIMGAGSQFDTAANTVAADYPDTYFVMVNGSQADYDNVAPIFPKEYEASFLAGIIAGELTTNGQFGTISGSINNPMNDLLDVYEEVAKEYAAARGIASPMAFRANADSWSDVNLGLQMTNAAISTNDVDVMFVYANQVGLGGITACEEADPQVHFIGFSADQNAISEVVTASIVFDFATFYVWAVELFLEGELEGGMIHPAGIKEGMFVPVYVAGFDQDIIDAVDAGIAAVQDDTIDLTEYFFTN